MIYLFLVLVAAAAFVTRQLVTCFALALLALMLASNITGVLNWPLIFGLYLSLLILPLSSCLIGHVSAGIFEMPGSRKSLSFLAACFGFLILFETDFFKLSLDLFLLQQSNAMNAIALLTIINKVAFSSGLIALVLIAIIALTELPAHWCLRRRRTLTRYIPIFRPTLVIVVVTLLFERLMSALTHTLL